ncbi:hypothetical protein NAEGRDRAFT_58906 [Naegleria gruberi]|uniref:Uncharacterized protein n=1 Tax=Naegleria gruberi TaxID=5762 RepID=D2VPZ4_NAEGR|nr:uncharacterized protein NAEGRDRAFT_58906 [Naegleria gruberi]EFC41091.1 hypothetical protein NAEGRDRAFT_58906 [Naegleria gruberi]|eukprot:XP_002673835.1 hypothetical protein NAEGRDRAFT_58906 [Naegleria gruberi strain NEG-M]
MTEFETFDANSFVGIIPVPEISLERQDSSGTIHHRTLSSPNNYLSEPNSSSPPTIAGANGMTTEEDFVKAMLYDACLRGDLKFIQESLQNMAKEYQSNRKSTCGSLSSSSSLLANSVLNQTATDLTADVRYMLLYTTFPEHQDCNLVHIAAKSNQVDILQWLLTGEVAHHIDAQQSPFEESNFTESSSPRSPLVNQLLLATDNHDATPIFYACQSGAQDACVYLCSFKCVQDQLNTQHDKYGYLPLYIALKRKDYDLCDLLQLFGAKVDVLVGNSETLLHYAVREKDIQMVEYLAKIKPNLLLRKNQREENPLFSLLSDSRGGRRRKKRTDTISDLEFADSTDKFMLGSLVSDNESYLNGSVSSGGSFSVGSLGNSNYSSQQNVNANNEIVEEEKMFFATFLFKGTLIFGVDTFEKSFLQKNSFGRNIIMECVVLNDMKAFSTLSQFLKDYCATTGTDRFVNLLVTETDQQQRNLIHLAIEGCAKQAASWISRHLIQLDTMSDRPVDRNSVSSMFSSRSVISNVEIETFITHQRYISCLESTIDFVESLSGHTSTALGTLYYAKDKLGNIPEDSCKAILKEYQLPQQHMQQIMQTFSNTLQNGLKNIKTIERKKTKPKQITKSGSFSWRKSQRSTHNLFSNPPPNTDSLNISIDDSVSPSNRMSTKSLYGDESSPSHAHSSTSKKLSKIKAAFMKRLRK